MFKTKMKSSRMMSNPRKVVLNDQLPFCSQLSEIKKLQLKKMLKIASLL